MSENPFPGARINQRGPVSALIGTGTSCTRTIGEYDISAFAGISGDNHPNHTDEEYARRPGHRREDPDPRPDGLSAAPRFRFAPLHGEHAVS